jgi:hypothetical protein
MNKGKIVAESKMPSVASDASQLRYVRSVALELRGGRNRCGSLKEQECRGQRG